MKGAAGFVVVCVMAAAAVVQAQQAPTRDRAAAAAPTVGTASLSGVVMTDGENGQPMRHVTVVLGQGSTSMPRVSVSDDQGRFAFTDLPSGSYLLAAMKPGWVVAGSRPRGMGQNQGIPVAVRDGQAVTGQVLRLHKGGVVSGVVRLSGGRPAVGAQVQALMVSSVSGTRTASMTAAPVTADDQGRYRIFGLPPGQYVVQVDMSMLSLMTQAADMRQVLPSEVVWAEALSARPALAPGMAQPEAAPPPEVGPTVAYAKTYFPGTAFLSDAAAIPVGAGDERLNLDMELRLVPTATVSGTVMQPDGTPAAGAMVSLNLPSSGGQEDLMAQVMQMAGLARNATRPDGSFVITGVAPGSYDLLVRGGPPRAAGRGGAPAAPAMPAMAAALFGGSTGSTQTLFARERVDVNGLPVGPLGLTLREGLKVSGTVVFEGSAKPSPETVRVSLAEPNAALAGMPDIVPLLRMNPSIAQVKADTTFELTGLMPGLYKFSVMMPGMRLVATEAGQGWMVKSVRLGDRDLADAGVDLSAGGDVSGVVVTLTDRPSELTGRVLDGEAKPVSMFPIVVFSSDRAHWGPTGRRVHAVQPATDGSFVIAGLPAGQYYMAAVTEVDPRELTSVAFLESLIPSAITVTLADGERKSQDVKVAR